MRCDLRAPSVVMFMTFSRAGLSIVSLKRSTMRVKTGRCMGKRSPVRWAYFRYA
ncbi:hypothetical protein D3C85_1946080 [compost metagenome]